MESSGDIDWVRRVNSRWIVGEALRSDTCAFLDHLAKCDPERLAAAGARARLTIGLRPPGEDPKPWFYAGIFSLATFVEAERFLGGHRFTIACLPALADTSLGSLHSGNVGPTTWEKIRRIRGVMELFGENDGANREGAD